MRELERRGRVHPRAPRILIIGAGAVGQVYGLHLQKGGAEVDVYVRPKYVAECRAGLTLYRMTSARGRAVERFVPREVLTTPEQVAGTSYDQVWLCISTSALEKALAAKNSAKRGLERLLRSIGTATFVQFQPGLHVSDLLAPIVPSRQIVQGGIAMVAYQAPLVEDEVDEPGVAFTLQTSPFTGADAVSVVAALKAGKCPAKVHPDARSMMAFGSATLMPLMAALEGADWKLKGLRKREWAKLAADAAAEAREVTAAQLGSKPPAMMGLLGASLIQLATVLAPGMLPFEVEIYLRYHFTKVRDQTRILLDRYIDEGIDRGVSITNLSVLRSRVFGLGVGGHAPQAA